MPLIDLPAHLARLEIIDHLLGNGPLASYYDLVPGLVPNLLFDGMGWAMVHTLPISAIGPVYILFTLSVQLFGTLFLHRTLNQKYSYWPLVSALLLYNIDLFYGFLSYLAGVGLALLSLALWIGCRDRSPLLRAAVGSVAAMLLFLTHIIPLLLYAAGVVGYELQVAIGLRRRPGTALRGVSVSAVQFLLPAGIFLWDTPTAELAGESAIFWTEGKIASLLATPTSGSGDLDPYLMAAAFVIAALAVVAIRVRFAARFAGAFACILAVFALMPWGLGPVVNLDIRMPLAILLIAIAATDVILKRARLGTFLACAMIAVLIGRMATVSAQTAIYSKHLDAYRAAFHRLRPGGILFVGVNDSCPNAPPSGCTCTGCRPASSVPFLETAETILSPEIYVRRLVLPRHIAAMATIDRDVFVPQIFATRGLQPVAVRTQLEPLKRLQGDDPITIRTPEMLRQVTAELTSAAHAAAPGLPVYLLLQRMEGAADLAPEDPAVVARGPQFTLLQLAGPSLAER
jgi:hypothetical protein